MWTMADTTVTTATMTALSASKRSAHCTCKSPVSIQVKRSVPRVWPPSATATKRMTPNTAARLMPAQATSCAPRSPIQRPKKPAMKAPSSGRKMAAIVTRSALHQMDVFDRDGAAVAEIDDDGEADRRLRRGHGQHEHGEDLADQIAEKGREGDEVDVDGEQHQLDRHQDDDDVLAVEENTEDPQREQDRGNRQVMGEADREHVRHIPWRGRTLTISSVSSRRRPTWRAMF